MPSKLTTTHGLRVSYADAERLKKLALRLGCTPTAAAGKCCQTGLDELEGIADHMTNPIMAVCFQLASMMTNEPGDHAEFKKMLASVAEFKKEQADKRAGQGIFQPEAFAT